MKRLQILFITLLIANCGLSQESRGFVFEIDSLKLDGIYYFPASIDDNIKVGEPKFFTLLETDSLALRLQVTFTKRKSQPKILKIRVDIFEDGKWYKAPLFIDIHGFHRFRIRREQCWMKSAYGYNAGFPFEMHSCQCWKPLKGKKSHEFNLWSKAIVN